MKASYFMIFDQNLGLSLFLWVINFVKQNRSFRKKMCPRTSKQSWGPGEQKSQTGLYGNHRISFCYHPNWKGNSLSHVRLCSPIDCSSPGSSVRGIFQARILEWIAIPISRRSSQPGDWTRSPPLQADSLPSEPWGKPIQISPLLNLKRLVEN